MFVRRAGVESAPSEHNVYVCPQCAAPTDKMGQSAVCGYCGAKISTGEFSWVLFLITQDENYATD
jgi:ribosomal protein L37AE/L43A